MNRILDQIPAMSADERQTLLANCRRALQQGNSLQKSSAKKIISALETAGEPAPAKTTRGAQRQRAGKAEPKQGARHFQPDAGYEALPGVADVLRAVDAGQPAILVLGRAGTGKTTLIRYLKQRPGGETQAIVAPTGIAAQNAGAQTIHSLFQLPPVILHPGQLPERGYFGALFRKMTRLIIDEISMVRADLLDAVDARLQEIRSNRQPVGGVQVVMVGDFMQLPPVVRDDDRLLLEQLGYETPFAFSARAFRSVKVTRVSLDHVFRQNERDFIDMLGKVRSGADIESTVRAINARCVRPHRDGAQPLLLTATLAAAERYNREGMERLQGQASIFGAETKGKTEGMQIPQPLELKPGARVMATRNDSERRWINGSLGTVSKIVGDDVYVRFDNDREEYQIEPVKWEKIRQVWNAADNKIENEVIGAFEQLPLMPAWAITIHKAQGLTLDDVRIDFGSGAFASGQVYVALSRVRTLDGLSLSRPLRASDLIVSPLLQAFINEQS